MLYRHGDVLLAQVARLPLQAQPLVGLTLVEGQATGHRHRMATGSSAQLWQAGSEYFVEVTGAYALLVHEEHHSIELPQGVYRFWRQREYRPEANTWVED